MENISIIGLGKLGSPMAAVFASKGFQVLGVDKNPHFVEAINNGLAPVDETGLQDLITQYHSNLQAISNLTEAIQNTDYTFVIVPTPSQSDGSFSNTYVLEAVKEIGEALKNKKTYHLVVITSTVMPGSTENEIQVTLEKHSNRKVGKDIGLCYSPEFIALGSVVRDMLNPDFYLIGESDKKAGDLLESIYLKSCDNTPRVERMNFVNAELTKIAINTFVTTKISYANMLSGICDYLKGSNIDVVTQAVGCDSRIGHKYLKSGTAYGGPCFPRDNIAFSTLAQQLKVPVDVAIATDSINQYQTERIVNFIQSQFLTSKKIGILGLSYKPHTAVIEESQGIKLAHSLRAKGYEVNIFDPLATDAAKTHLQDTVYYSTSAQDCIKNSDAIVIMTAWPEFKNISFEVLKSKSSEFFILDCWKILDPSKYSNTNIIYLGNGFLAHTPEKNFMTGTPKCLKTQFN